MKIIQSFTLVARLALVTVFITSSAWSQETSVYATGYNYYGQLGIGTSRSGSDRDVPTPAILPDGKQIAQISAGQDHSLMVTTDGLLYAMGSNNSSRLGLGDNIDRDTPTLVPMPDGKLVAQASAGNVHSLVVTTDGLLYVMGFNGAGQLGTGDRTTISTPTLVTLPDGKLVAQASAGDSHSLFVTTDGLLYGTGYNVFGQLGIGASGPGADRLVPTLATMPGGKLVKRVSAGGSFSMIVTTDELLYTTGYNSDGQLGTGDEINRNIPTLITIPGGANVAQVSAEGHNGMVTTVSGLLYVMGSDQYGQLGLGGIGDQNTPTLLTLPGSRLVAQISAGYHFNLIVTTDRKLYVAGRNLNGQLGTGVSGDASNENTPTLVNIPGQTVLNVAGGSFFSLILANALRVDVSDFPSSIAPGAPIAATLTAVGFTGSVVYNLSGDVPPGLSVSGNQIVGNPVIESSYSFTVTGTDGTDTASASLSLIVTPDPLVLVSDFPASITSGESINATISSSAFSGTVTYSLSGNVPEGLSIVGNQIVGSPTVEGNYSFLVTGTDGIDSDSESLNLTINPIVISETRSYNLYTNTFSYRNYPLNKEGVIAEPYEYEVIGSLPEGLKVEDGMLQGVVAYTGTYTFTIVLTNGVNQLTLHYTIHGVPPTLQPTFSGVWLNGVYTMVDIVEDSTHVTPAVTELYNAVVSFGVPLEMSFDWDYIKESQGYIIAGGTLPDGLTLNAEFGVISGAPALPGEYIFVVSVKDWRGRAYQWVRLVVE